MHLVANAGVARAESGLTKRRVFLEGKVIYVYCVTPLIGQESLFQEYYGMREFMPEQMGTFLYCCRNTIGS